MTVAFLGQMQGVIMDFNILKMQRVVLIKVSLFEKVKPFWLREVLKQQNQKIIMFHLSVFVLTLPGLRRWKVRFRFKPDSVRQPADCQHFKHYVVLPLVKVG
jgi:hypothetical protein